MYDTDQIKLIADCREIATALGIPKHSNGRYIATWRGGDGGNVQIDKDQWYDHKAKEGGDVIRLVETVRDEPFIMSVRWLAELLHIEPTTPPRQHHKPTRYDELTAEGYVETARYEYTDENGNTIQFVIRLEHPERKKEFLQCDSGGKWSVKHVTPVLYNLPVISKSAWAVIVEGEKDADTLRMWSIPATTNAGGAEKWQDSFSSALYGKDVVLIPDNDSTGQLHMDKIGKSLLGKAKSIRVLHLSQLHKGDVTDWVEKEGGTQAKFMQQIKKAELWVPPQDSEMMLAEAKEANSRPFSNYTEHEIVTPGKKGPAVHKIPRSINDMIEDVHMRFLDFPRKIGPETLFDHDRDTGEIHYITGTDRLFAWMQLKSKKPVKWAQGEGFATKGEFKEALIQNARRYESVSSVPDYPRRDDVYYSHETLPDPSPGHAVFEGLLNMFAPANESFRILLAAMFSAPIYHADGVNNPLWIIDSEDGAGTGKTTIAQAVATLYGCPPIQVSPMTLKYKYEDVVKSMLSASGRERRVFLLDNVTGSFKSDEMSGLVTMPYITGKAPYGRGEESRPNNLLYMITANSASIDNDLTSRAFFIFVKRADVTPEWKQSLLHYIGRNRLQIFADMLDRIKRGPDYGQPCQTRFPEFESTILQKQCKTLAEFKGVYSTLSQAREEANTEEELAHQIAEIFEQRIGDVLGITSPSKSRVFIPSKSVNMWLKHELDMAVRSESDYIQKVRDLSKNTLLRCIDSKIQRFPHHPVGGIRRTSGAMWIGENYDPESGITYVLKYENKSLQAVQM